MATTKAVVPTVAGQLGEYRRRWLMLALFVLCSCCNALHWIQFSIITNVVTRFFSVSSNAINLTAVVFGVCYVSFVLPAFWLLSRYVSYVYIYLFIYIYIFIYLYLFIYIYIYI